MKNKEEIQLKIDELINEVHKIHAEREKHISQYGKNSVSEYIESCYHNITLKMSQAKILKWVLNN